MSKIYIAAVQYNNGEEWPEDHIREDILLGAGATFDKAVELFKPHIETIEEFYEKIEDGDNVYFDLLGDNVFDDDDEDNITIYAEYEPIDADRFHYHDESSYVYYVIEMEVYE